MTNVALGKMSLEMQSYVNEADLTVVGLQRDAVSLPTVDFRVFYRSFLLLYPTNNILFIPESKSEV